ncbi:MAG: tRNA (adenosine(37)-N6)-threonylcarbamoyltransferase complex transferase subunit TsaD [Deltaproteobacteria bacterium]|jgi:N6-L-threonylcarbamoyladenine synthase|nr:tRNA (adenosine(37)-N6)-threonylcarbamoyltransferase complex transferase subunit TsaD [Deltaproteobacteria bacterium]MCW8893170.1 tRNA (adenosine(37)-N6)-threonylcarbamoyltransferase complex transferase subunit TsaD [Deltaproteobacteria bacterium]MCW9050576.1 tRNA (adenosine(37)-N6)-threonylcarbamoyltransferase complex transferase subunit TsaD [Deltaproteobacteria bacterium]
MLLLALESSCDETAAAVVRDGKHILSNLIASQVDLHAVYGGVVPELASRRHLEVINPLVEETLLKADIHQEDLDAVVVTRGPGLVGALLVGVSFAKAYAYALKVPLLGVHHIEGHILAIQLEREVAFPFLAAAVSGGHTHLYRVDGIGQYRLLGRTVDDAAGEAFDKVAKMLGLGYPGGPVIDRLAVSGDDGDIVFPRPMLKKETLDFSFSGVKTAVLNYLHRLKGPPTEKQVSQIASAFQTAVVDVLTQKIMRAADMENLERIVIAGGVACNSGLRRRFDQLAELTDKTVYFPSPILCADNAAMLAVAGDYYLTKGISSGLDLNAVSSWPLEQVTG